MGCAGTGVGFALDSSHYSTCLERISRSVAVQLSPHHNVTEMWRSGPHVAAGEPGYVAWGAMDEAGVYVGGSNQAALVTRSFAAPGRRGRLIDGLRHTVLALYAEGKLSVHFDGEAEPTLSANVDLGAAGAIDSSGRAWVGFTASTGISSIDADLLSFAFCQYPACDAA